MQQIEESQSGDKSPHSKAQCRVCTGAVKLLLDFGPQPICNRFLKQPSDLELRYRLRLGQCLHCGLLQLIDPVPANELKPTTPARYTEPESHLDKVAELISSLPGIHSHSPVCGVTAKDLSTLDRLVAKGFHDVSGLDVLRDFGIEDPSAGIETIQQSISDGVLRKHVRHHGRYQLLIARHILEHVHAIDRYIAELQHLLAPGGYIVIEVPDFAKSLSMPDYSTLWEEHVMYFTEATLVNSLERYGLRTVELQIHPYLPEDSLLAVAVRNSSAEKTNSENQKPEVNQLQKNLADGERYAALWPETKKQWRDLLLAERHAEREVAFLGAGHLGITFLNLLNLADIVDVVVDDDPQKCGQYLPGSRHLIQDITTLYARPIQLCLLSVSPEGEEAVLRRHQRFRDDGGRFRSIFPSSPLAMMSVGSEG